MRLYNYDEPFEDEELEARAWAHYEAAREQGSTLPEAQLMRECRELAHRDLIRMQEMGDEPVPLAEEEEGRSNE